jgi:hypothetical protein
MTNGAALGKSAFRTTIHALLSTTTTRMGLVICSRRLKPTSRC